MSDDHVFEPNKRYEYDPAKPGADETAFYEYKGPPKPGATKAVKSLSSIRPLTYAGTSAFDQMTLLRMRARSMFAQHLWPHTILPPVALGAIDTWEREYNAEPTPEQTPSPAVGSCDFSGGGGDFSGGGADGSF